MKTFYKIKNKIQTLRCAAEAGVYEGQDLKGKNIFRHRLLLISLKILVYEFILNLVKLFIIATKDSAASFILLFQNEGEKLNCPYSYRHFKTIHKKVRLFSAAATSVLVVATVITSLIFNMFFGGSPSTFAGTYTFTQTSWDAAADTNATIVHPDTGTSYYSKDAQIDTTTTPGSVTLASTNGSVVQTDDTAETTGFNLAGKTFDQTELAGTDNSAKVSLESSDAPI